MRETRRQRANRRDARRLPPRQSTRAGCFVAGSTTPDLLLSLLDLSQSGARLILRGSVAVGTELELSLESPQLPQPLRVPMKVVWSLPLTDGRHCIGARFVQPMMAGVVEILAHRYAGAGWLFPAAPVVPEPSATPRGN